MFDMSWGEIMVIGGVALIVIGPKDLPKTLRTVGQMTAKVRRLAGEFQNQFSEAMREAELEDVRREMEGMQRDVSSATSGAFNPIQTIRDELKGAVEAKPAGSSSGIQDHPSPAASSTETDTWSSLPEPPTVPEPIVASAPEAGGWSEYGPAQTSAPGQGEARAADGIDPEARPNLPEKSGTGTEPSASERRSA